MKNVFTFHAKFSCYFPQTVFIWILIHVTNYSFVFVQGSGLEKAHLSRFMRVWSFQAGFHMGGSQEAGLSVMTLETLEESNPWSRHE